MQELYNNYFNIASKQIWKVAIYARLSREDEKDEKYKGQSEEFIKYKANELISTILRNLNNVHKQGGKHNEEENCDDSCGSHVCWTCSVRKRRLFQLSSIQQS